ncbi:hypothetical protein E2C01_037799 [Portunus trituberculatus]|uniref:Uncharacterized protein n=1 Tax=Portunus trituberculatus TaxID=210409 RepID=A0A5B7FFJ9_PORTR|nr:hypothetical protein [Portunus trituberculatus]
MGRMLWSRRGQGVAQKTRHSEAPRRGDHRVARVLPTHHAEAPRRGDHKVAQSGEGGCPGLRWAWQGSFKV